MSTDAIVVLRAEHKEIKRLFRSFEKAEKANEKQKLVKQIIEMLMVHTYIENEGMYPQVRKMVPDLESDILESYEEHHVADLLLAELAEMTPADERFTAKVTVLIESVEHHIEEEESSWFPDVREALGRKQLQEIGAEMVRLRKKAPRRPKRKKTEAVEPAPAMQEPPAKKSAAKKSAATEKSTAKQSAEKKSPAKKSAARKAAPSTSSQAGVPAQADVESLPSLTPPPLPGANGPIELVDASLPGAQTQDAPQGDEVPA
jgi:hemerythrin-like domain-containing protein